MLTILFYDGIIYEQTRGCGETGRRKGLKIPRVNNPCRFDPGQRHQKTHLGIRLDAFFSFVGYGLRIAFANKYLQRGLQFELVQIPSLKALASSKTKERKEIKNY